MPSMVNHYEESVENGVWCPAFSTSEKCLVLLNGMTVTDSQFVYWSGSGRFHWSMVSSKVTHWMPYPDSNGATHYWSYD